MGRPNVTATPLMPSSPKFCILYFVEFFGWGWKTITWNPRDGDELVAPASAELNLNSNDDDAVLIICNELPLIFVVFSPLFFSLLPISCPPSTATDLETLYYLSLTPSPSQIPAATPQRHLLTMTGT